MIPVCAVILAACMLAAGGVPCKPPGDCFYSAKEGKYLRCSFNASLGECNGTGIPCKPSE